MQTRKFLAVLTSCLLFTLSPALTSEGKTAIPEDLIRKLDCMVDNKDLYVSMKQDRIDSLKHRLGTPGTDRMELYGEIAGEYRKFQSDSAAGYLNRAISIARDTGDRTSEIRYTIALAEQYTLTGLYMEAEYVLSLIDRQEIREPDKLEDYWMACYNVYREAGYARPHNAVSRIWRARAGQYRDSILCHSKSVSNRTLRLRETELREAGHPEQALEINDIRIGMAEYLSPDYAYTAYDRFCIYQEMGREDEAMEFLVRSAISDINSAIMNQSSLYVLANKIFGKDLDRAWKYVNYSYWATTFFNERFRHWTYNSSVFEINKTWQQKLGFQRSIISVISCALGILVLILAGLAVYITSINRKLNRTNRNLEETSRIKDSYVSQFFKLYSSYLNSMQKFRSKIHKQLKRGDEDEVLRLTRPSGDIINEEIHDLYRNFDMAFLDIFPDFVDRFNDLLLPDKKITLKKGELLNTELRIFAMIRLGINESAQIAELLHYSIRTVYNYRSGINRKTHVKDRKFEEHLMRIS